MAEKLKTNHLSRPRNKLLASVFYYVGFIEAWGRGTTMMVDKCVEQGLPEPEFIEEHGVMTVMFYQDKWNLENLNRMGLNERQRIAVQYTNENNKITNLEYRKLTGSSDEGSRIDLNNLVNLNIFSKIGKGRGVHYILKKSGN